MGKLATHVSSAWAAGASWNPPLKRTHPCRAPCTMATICRGVVSQR